MPIAAQANVLEVDVDLANNRIRRGKAETVSDNTPISWTPPEVPDVVSPGK